MKLLKILSKADLITLVSLFIAIYAIYFLFIGNTYLAINLSLLAFILDITDGFISRKGMTSEFGPKLDSHADIFTYIIFSSVLYLLRLSESPVLMSLVAVVLFTSTAILRLIRFTHEGPLKLKSKRYYLGVPVFIPYIYFLLFYFIHQIYQINLSTLSFVSLLIFSYLMISEIKIRYTRNPSVLTVLLLSLFILNIYAH